MGQNNTEIQNNLRQRPTRLNFRNGAVTRIPAAEQAVQAQILKDPLTGLYNRRAFNEFLPKEINRANHDSMPLALVMVDIDNFKKINDNEGHAAGDKKLIEIAEILQNITRKGDLVCRYGGEEFAIIMPGAFLNDDEGNGFNSHLERIRAEIEKIAVSKDNAIGTISMGVAMLDPDMDVAGFIEAADEALYKAKNQGRNRVVWAEIKEE